MQQTSSTKKSVFNRLSNQISLLTGKSINSEMKEGFDLEQKNWRKQMEFKSTLLPSSSSTSFSSSSFFNPKLLSTGLERKKEVGRWKERGEGGQRMREEGMMKLCEKRGRKDGEVRTELKKEGGGKKEGESKFNVKMNERDWGVEKKEGRRQDGGERIDEEENL